MVENNIVDLFRKIEYKLEKNIGKSILILESFWRKIY